MLLTLPSAGCVGLTAGGSAGFALSTEGRTRVDVEAPVGVGTRFYSEANTSDTAGTLHLGLRPGVIYRPDVEAFGASVGPSVGGGHYWGRFGLVGLATVGVLADPIDAVAPSHRGRFFVRAQLGAELETSEADWRIDQRPGTFSQYTYVPRKPNHAFVGIWPGIEWVAEANELPAEWNLHLSGSFRGMFEPAN